MKKLMILSAILLLILSGCHRKRFDNASMSFNSHISDEDGEAILDFLQDTVKRGVTDLKPEEKYIGGLNMGINFEKGNQLTAYAFLQDTLYVSTSDGVIREYKINADYFKNEFYPTMSRLFDKYAPVVYQATNNPKTSITLEKDGTTTDISSKREMFWTFGMYIAACYGNGTEYTENELPLYKIIIDDSVVREELNVYADYVVINNEKIMMYSGFDPNFIMAE